MTDAERELLDTLKEAREMLIDWAAYAPQYFKEKWNLEGDIAELDAVIAKHTTRKESQ